MGASAAAESAVSPEIRTPGNDCRPRQKKSEAVAATATERHVRASIRLRRLDTVALMERMHPLIDTRDAGIVNAFIASLIVALAGIQEPAFSVFGSGRVKKSTTATRCYNQ